MTVWHVRKLRLRISSQEMSSHVCRYQDDQVHRIGYPMKLYRCLPNDHWLVDEVKVHQNRPEGIMKHGKLGLV